LIYSLPSTTFQAVLTGAPTGLTGSSLTVRVLNTATGSDAIAETSSGITENPSGTGIYIASLTAPSAIGEYVVIWKATASSVVTRVAEELFVTGTPPSPTTTATGEQASVNLAGIRTEVLNHGFDPSIYTASRVNQYINDAIGELSAKAQYYGEQQQYSFTATTASTPLPSGLTKVISIRLTDTGQELVPVDIRDIDRSGTSAGTPMWYALNGGNLILYPTPDQSYATAVRYFKTMSPLVSDTDVPSLPARYHLKLSTYAIARCFEAEDDPQQATYYQQMWDKTIRELKADVIFPTLDGARQIRSQWDDGMRKPGWGFY
jgi:hypothetical protein